MQGMSHLSPTAWLGWILWLEPLDGTVGWNRWPEPLGRNLWLKRRSRSRLTKGETAAQYLIQYSEHLSPCLLANNGTPLQGT